MISSQQRADQCREKNFIAGRRINSKGLKREQWANHAWFSEPLAWIPMSGRILWTIVENIVRLTATEKEELKNVLQKTSLSRIISSVKLIENR